MNAKSARVSARQPADRREEGAQGAEPPAVDLLMAVERIVESPAAIERQVEAIVQEVRHKLPEDAAGAQIRALAEQKIIARYANRAAMAGGAASLPALIPGIGTMAAFVGGGLADMTLCLKYEVEMMLALSSLHGFDIRDPRERQLAYLLAASHTYASTPGGAPIADFLKIELDAIWHYTPRQLGKIVAGLFVKLAVLYSGKGFVRAVPLVGLLVSGGLNKALAHRLGKSAVAAFARRPRPGAEGATRARAARDPAAKAARAPKKARAKKAGKAPAA